jgi:hypothetical protein
MVTVNHDGEKYLTYFRQPEASLSTVSDGMSLPYRKFEAWNNEAVKELRETTPLSRNGHKV